MRSDERSNMTKPKDPTPEAFAVDSKAQRPLRSFGRTGGRPLSPRRAQLVEELLPSLSVPASGELTPAALFGRRVEQTWLEIGFGGGEHLAEQAARNPACGLIGAEPFVEGVAKLLAEIEQRSLSNVRVHAGDARDIISRLPAQTLDRLFILFPDPWPKTRHQKRRLVQPAFLASIAHTLKPGAKIRFATDIASYADEALAAFLADGRFAWRAQRAADWCERPSDHIVTRYERKHLGDCPPVFLDLEFVG